MVPDSSCKAQDDLQQGGAWRNHSQSVSSILSLQNFPQEAKQEETRIKPNLWLGFCWCFPTSSDPVLSSLCSLKDKIKISLTERPCSLPSSLFKRKRPKIKTAANKEMFEISVGCSSFPSVGCVHFQSITGWLSAPYSQNKEPLQREGAEVSPTAITGVRVCHPTHIVEFLLLSQQRFIIQAWKSRPAAGLVTPFNINQILEKQCMSWAVWSPDFVTFCDTVRKGDLVFLSSSVPKVCSV